MVHSDEVRKVIEELEAERDFLISEISHTFDHEELINKSGRLYVVNKLIVRLEEIL